MHVCMYVSKRKFLIGLTQFLDETHLNSRQIQNLWSVEWSVKNVPKVMKHFLLQVQWESKSLLLSSYTKTQPFSQTCL